MATAEPRQIFKTKSCDYIALAKERLQELGQRYFQRKDLRTFQEMKSLLKLLQEAGQQQKEYDLINAWKTPQLQLEDLKLHLDNCGSLARRKWYCKPCEKEKLEALLGDEKIYQTCGIRYCPKIKCILTKFAKQIESLKNIKRLKNLKKLDHFVIGFEPVTKEEFRNNFDKIKKQQERVLNSLFSKLRMETPQRKPNKITGKIRKLKDWEKLGSFNIQAFKVLDITFTLDKNKIYIHYHIIALPLKSNRKISFMKKSQGIRKDMLKGQRVKIPFHIQFFGLKDKDTLLSYLTLRAIGLYKFHDKKEDNYEITDVRKLKDLLKQKKFMLLKDIISLEDYQKHFYNHRHFTTLGGLPYGSIIMDNVVSKFPNFCKKHGKLERHQVRMELIIEIPPAPPPNTAETPKIAVECLGEAREHREMKELLKQKSKENEYIRDGKRFWRFCKSKEGKKLKKSDLDFEDRLNLFSTGKC